MVPNRIISSCLGFIFVILSVQSISGQSTDPNSNPFELRERLTVVLPAEKAAENNPQNEEGKSGNPFEIVPADSAEKQGAIEKSVDPAITRLKEILNPPPGLSVDSEPVSGFWLGIYTLFASVFLAILMSFFRKQVQTCFRAFSNQNMMNLLYRQSGEAFAGPMAMLLLFYLLSAGFYTFLVADHYHFGGMGRSATAMVVATGFIGILSVGRILILKGVGGIFPFGVEVNLYLFTILIFDIILGLLLFPLAIGIAFLPAELTEFAVPVSLLLLLSFYAYRTLRALSVGAKFIISNKFHFFLYLCTVEIAPLVIIVKLITDWGSTV